MKYALRIVSALLPVAPLLTILCAGEAHAADPVLTIGSCNSGPYTYALQTGQSLPAASAAHIGTAGATDVTWSADWVPANNCTGADPSGTCADQFDVTLPSGLVSSSAQVDISGNGNSLSSGTLMVTSTSNVAAEGSCTGSFTLHVTSSGGGWGDPHLTTVDGVHYDFQSAGEFTALKDDTLVIQTRQSPVPTATVPITNAYTGITHCVAIYTAVAAKLGSTRVTLQPSPGAVPDPKSMQLRVNGKLTTLGETPLILRAQGDAAKDRGGKIDGTLTRHSDGVIEMTDARGTQLVVTPSYWDNQKVWYLNVNVYGTSAHLGTMGSIAKESWLPALPDGTSLGAKPAAEADRYQALYEKFADAWRVTAANSLFDYEPGTTTATFTRDEWPRNHPETCAIEGQTSVQAVAEQVAQQACANVANATQRADCVFDVMITGHTGFAKTYETTQRFKPRAAGWYSPVPFGGSTKPPPKTPVPACPGWCCWLLVALGVFQLMLLILLVSRSRANKA